MTSPSREGIQHIDKLMRRRYLEDMYANADLPVLANGQFVSTTVETEYRAWARGYAQGQLSSTDAHKTIRAIKQLLYPLRVLIGGGDSARQPCSVTAAGTIIKRLRPLADDVDACVREYEKLP